MSHGDQFFGGETHSQAGEDLAILNIFHALGIHKPSYLDVGCHHPVNISNTFLLYQRGCRGVAVDANPNLVDLWANQRPEDRFYVAGVSDKRGWAEYHMIDGLSGRNTLSAVEADEFVREHPRFSVKQRVPCETMTLDDVKVMARLDRWPELISVDLEGMDQRVVESASFNWYQSPATAPKVVCAEVREHERRGFDAMMAGKGYHSWARFVSHNVLYVHHGIWDKVR